MSALFDGDMSAAAGVPSCSAPARGGHVGGDGQYVPPGNDKPTEYEETTTEPDESGQLAAVRANLRAVLPDETEKSETDVDDDTERPASAGLLDLADLRSRPLPPREWLETGLFEMHAVNKLTAASGTGKSLLLVDMAVSWSLGRSALDVGDDGQHRKLGLGDREGDPLRVLYVDGELGPRWWHRYLDKFGAPLDLPDLHVMTLTDDAPVWGALCDSHGAEQFLDWVAELTDELGRFDVIILDTLSAFVGGEENSNDTWADFDRLVTLPLKRQGVTIVYADHTGHTAVRARGGSAKKAKLDVEVILTVPDPDGDPNLLELTTDPRQGKMRNGHDGHPMTVHLRRADGPLGHVRHTPGAKEIPGKRVADDILAVLADHPEGSADGLTGEEISDKVTGKAAAVRGSLRHLVRAGQVIETKVPRPIRNGTRSTLVYQIRQTPKHTRNPQRGSAESENNDD
ncbi:MAG: AAA family ATPase [Gordonia polyisoprenivorans]|nr:AAA family ATPase [Gordonia polyisoprenivorans]